LAGWRGMLGEVMLNFTHNALTFKLNLQTVQQLTREGEKKKYFQKRRCHWYLLLTFNVTYLYVLHFTYIRTSCFKTKSVKQSHYRPEQAQRMGRSVAQLFRDLGARRGWVVSLTPLPLYPREIPGTHCTGGWVGLRAGLDVCEKSCPHRDSSLGLSSP
jgi:hypothetical protein